MELDLERSIGQPASLLEELDNLVDHLIEVHHRPSTCASTASVSGSHNVISISRYMSIAADNAARACLEIQGAKATVAVGLERTHAEFLSQGEGLMVVDFGLLDVRGRAMCCDVA